MNSIGAGIIEGFFGPEWSWEDRHSFVEFVAANSGAFYIYAPKRDPYLRKKWTQNHPKEAWDQLKALSGKCQALNLKFGIGLSPFELHNNWNEASKRQLRERISTLEDLEFDYLGLFFDDMKGSPDLADKQVEIVEHVRQLTKKKIFFCPTYYSEDPILDRVFGERPPGYLEKLGSSISADVEFFWTGPRVISQSLLASDLKRVSSVIKRKPLVWENFYANDGPKNCKFLKLKPYKGRDHEAFESSSGWAFNLMNQANLSKIVFLAGAKVLLKNRDSLKALEETTCKLAGREFGKFVLAHQQEFLKIGVDKLGQDFQSRLRSLARRSGPFGVEVVDWLDGRYAVGSECLTD